METENKNFTNNEIKVLDVKARLAQLRQWQSEYIQEIQKLDDELNHLGESKRDIRRGYQISLLKNFAKYRLVREPIYIDMNDLLAYGVEKYHDELIRQYACLTIEEKILWLNNLLLIFTPQLKMLDDKVNYLVDYQSFGQGRNLLISGISGTGKSTFLFWRASLEPAKVVDGYNEVPIIIIQSPVNNKSAKFLFQRIITGMGKVYLDSDNDEDLFEKAVVFINKCKVRLLILDEISHIKQPELRRRVLELSNATQICIIGSSVTPEGFVEGDLEIRGRFNDIIPLKPYTGEEFIALLLIIDLLLPFPKSSELYKKEIIFNNTKIDGPMTIIENFTHGLIRDTMRLLYDASLSAIKTREDKVSVELLKRSWMRICNKEIESLHDKIQKDLLNGN